MKGDTAFSYNTAFPNYTKHYIHTYCIVSTIVDVGHPFLCLLFGCWGIHIAACDLAETFTCHHTHGEWRDRNSCERGVGWYHESRAVHIWKSTTSQHIKKLQRDIFYINHNIIGHRSFFPQKVSTNIETKLLLWLAYPNNPQERARFVLLLIIAQYN